MSRCLSFPSQRSKTSIQMQTISSKSRWRKRSDKSKIRGGSRPQTVRMLPPLRTLGTISMRMNWHGNLKKRKIRMPCILARRLKSKTLLRIMSDPLEQRKIAIKSPLRSTKALSLRDQKLQPFNHMLISQFWYLHNLDKLQMLNSMKKQKMHLVAPSVQGQVRILKGKRLNLTPKVLTNQKSRKHVRLASSSASSNGLIARSVRLDVKQTMIGRSWVKVATKWYAPFLHHDQTAPWMKLT